MAEIVRYVDPDATGAGNGTSWTDAYTSLGAAEAALDGGSNAGDDLVINCRSSSGSADTSAFTFGGFTYDSVTVQAVSGHETVKTGYDNTRYRIEAAGSTVITFSDAVPITLIGIQVKNTASNAYAYVLYCANVASAATLTLRNCRIVSAGENANRGGIRNADDDCTLILENSIVEGFNYIGVYGTNGVVTLKHSIVYGTSATGGVYQSGSATCTAINSAVSGTGNDFNGTIDIDNCASDDGDGDGAIGPSGGDWTNEFVAPATGNWTLLNSGNCYHGGSAAAGVETDIDGDNYDASTPSIGCDEYVAAGGGTTLTVVCSDSIAFSDGDLGLGTFLGMGVDALSVGDNALRTAALLAMGVDALTLNDSALRGMTLLGNSSDSLTVNDSSQRALTLIGQAVDSLAFDDGALSIATLFGIASDSIAINDSVNYAGAILAFASDAFSLNDLGAGNVVYVVTASDAITVDDVTTVEFTIRALASDGVALSDSVRVQIAVDAHAVDGVSLSDAALALGAFLGAASDGITINDIAISVSGGIATGNVTVTFSSRRGDVSMTVLRPGTSIAAKTPGVDIAGKGPVK